MIDMQTLMDQLVSEISFELSRLDETRLKMFTDWLIAHSSRVRVADRVDFVPDSLENGLKSWFASLPMQGLLWEYHLLLIEIAWLRRLDPSMLAKLMQVE